MPVVWNRIEQFFKKNYIRYLEKLLGRNTLNPDELDCRMIDRILILRPHDQLGDFILSTPVLEALRKRFPQAHIGIVVRSYVADTLKYNPFIDQIIIFYESGKKWTIKRSFELIKALYKKWDFAIVLNVESHSLTTDLLAHFSGAKYILGSDRYPFKGCKKNFFYNLIAPTRKHNKHQTELNMDIVRYIGADSDDLSEKIFVSDRDVEIVQQKLDAQHSRTLGPRIGLHIGASKIDNRWQIDKFCTLGRQLIESVNAQLLLFWGPKENELVAEFESYSVFDYIKIPPSSLYNLAVYFTLCNIVVCNDTGTMHLCAGVGTSMVAIFGPTDPKFWKPIGNKFIAVRGKNNQTQKVTVEQVKTKVLELL